MATQVQAGALPRWGTSRASPGGVIGQITTLITRPKAFFEHMPRTRHWLAVAMLILGIAGFAAANQGTQAQTSTAASSTPASFNVGMLQNGSSAQTIPTANTQVVPSTTTTAVPTTPQASSTDTNTTLMSALLAAGGAMALWIGQALLLSLVTMFRGYAPDMGRCLQISVWASLPLALMLILRQVNFAAGGSGGSVGLSLLLTKWNGYTSLGELAQRIMAVFMSNLSLFWLWDLVLLYFGARHALSGNRLAVMLVIGLWIVTSSIAPALVSTPVTTTAPRTTTTTTTTTTTEKTSTSSSSSASAQQANMFGGMPGGSMPSGSPPSGGMPGGAPGGN